MYYGFDVPKLRNDLKTYAKNTSYRHIEDRTGGSLKRTKIGRLVQGQGVFGLRDMEVVVNLLNANISDYVIEYPF